MDLAPIAIDISHYSTNRMRHDKNYKSEEEINAAYGVAVQGGISGAARVSNFLFYSMFPLKVAVCLSSLISLFIVSLASS